MKKITIIYLALTFLTGCVSAKESKQPATPPPAKESSFVVLAADEVPQYLYDNTVAKDPSVMRPGLQHAYFIGRTLDPNNPNIMFDSKVVYRREVPERWNLNPARQPANFEQGPVSFRLHSALHPEPTQADVDQFMHKAATVAELLARQNRELRAEIDALKTAMSNTGGGSMTGQPPPVPKGATGVVVVNNPDTIDALELYASKRSFQPAPGYKTLEKPLSRTRENFTLVRPNAERVIELDPSFFNPPNLPTNNPFLQIYQPKLSLKEVMLNVTATMPGTPGGTVINGQPYLVDETVNGLTIYDVDTDTVYLRKDMFLLACPVGEHAITLRLP